MKRAARGLAALLTGTLAFLLLHLFLEATWQRLFLVAPWPDYEQSARLGLIEPWFVNTPRSLWLTRITFFLLALGSALVLRRGRWSAAFLLWAGAAIGVIAMYASTSMPALPSGRVGYVIYPFRVLLPILLGTAAAALLRGSRCRARAAEGGEGTGP